MPRAQRTASVLALALVPLLLALAWRVGELALPPHHEHAWRDADGLGVARCFVREGFDLLRPRVMERGATSGIVGMSVSSRGGSTSASSSAGSCTCTCCGRRSS